MGGLFGGRAFVECCFFVFPTTCHICGGDADMVVSWFSMVWYPSTCPICNGVADRVVGWILHGISSLLVHLPCFIVHVFVLFLMCGDVGFLLCGKVGGVCMFVFFVFGCVVVQLNDKDLFVGVFRFRVKLGFWVVGWGVVGG